MDKLTLEHIAPYLPYNTRAIDSWGRIKYIRGLSLNPFSVLFIRLNDKDYLLDDSIKPILRPISDLTKEIYHNGEIFVPMDVVGDSVNDICKSDFVTDWSDKGGCFHEYTQEFIDRQWNNHHLDYMPFGFIQKLLEWHFDIFGLIDKGLAIDINTVKEASK